MLESFINLISFRLDFTEGSLNCGNLLWLNYVGSVTEVTLSTNMSPNKKSQFSENYSEFIWNETYEQLIRPVMNIRDEFKPKQSLVFPKSLKIE